MSTRTKMGFTEAEKALMVWRREQNSSSFEKPFSKTPASPSGSDSTSDSSSPRSSPYRIPASTDWRGISIVSTNEKNPKKERKKKKHKRENKKHKIKKSTKNKKDDNRHNEDNPNHDAGSRSRGRSRSRSNDRSLLRGRDDRHNYVSRERSLSVESWESADSLGRSLRPGEKRKKRTKLSSLGHDHNDDYLRSDRSPSRSLSPTSLAQKPAPPDPKRIDHDDRNRVHQQSMKSSYHASSIRFDGNRNGLGYRRSRSRSPIRDRRINQRKHDDDLTWNHDGFINSLRDPSPERTVPLNYVPPKPEWKSKAGGVYIPTVYDPGV